MAVAAINALDLAWNGARLSVDYIEVFPAKATTITAENAGLERMPMRVTGIRSVNTIR